MNDDQIANIVTVIAVIIGMVLALIAGYAMKFYDCIEFTDTIKKMFTDGVSAKAAAVIRMGQSRFNEIYNVPPDQHSEVIKNTLLDVRDQLLDVN